ncbi:MAG: NfeD family protein [Ruminococcaceae bacterium]|nr:NfeD family protein [Oscillospiraceae bacterium]
MEYFAEHAVAIWVVLLIGFSVIEAVTVQLVSVWFAVGSLAALIASLFKVGVVGQLVIFLVVSIICFIITRPLVKRFSQNKIQSTNADRCIGQTAVVTEEIDNIKASGQVKVNGNIWTARSENGEIIPVDSMVTVIKIEGVKLIVKTEKE